MLYIQTINLYCNRKKGDKIFLYFMTKIENLFGYLNIFLKTFVFDKFFSKRVKLLFDQVGVLNVLYDLEQFHNMFCL